MSDLCIICSRNLIGGRTASCNTHLKHTGRPIYEVLKQFLPQEYSVHSSFSDRNSKNVLWLSENNENIVKANQSPYSECSPNLQNLIKTHKLCFRCYRLILGVDYHGYELGRLKGQISQLCEASIVKDDTDAKDDVLSSNLAISAKNSIGNNSDSINERVVESMYTTDRDNEHIVDENISLDKKFKVSKDELNTGSNLVMANSVFDSDCKTKRNRKCKRLNDFEYLDDNEKRIFKKKLNDNAENYSKEINKESYSNSTKKAPILCKKCHKNFKTKKSFNSHGCHKEISSIRKKAFSCKVCGIRMKIKQNYEEHVESCYKNVAVQCNHCPVKLPSAAFLPRHMEVFHEGEPVSSKEVLCDQCGREFTRKESLDRHQATVHGISYGQHQCSQCGRMFLHTSLLAEHMRAHRGYNCDQCTKTFSCASNLRLHLRTHHQNKHLYRCVKCNKHWKFHTSYIYHMRKVHAVDRHKCSRCRQHFPSEADFIAHKNNCHKENSNIKNKENESRLSTNSDMPKKFLQDSQTNKLNKSSPLLSKKDLKSEPIHDCLPMLPPTKTAFTLASQEIIAFRDQSVVYSRIEDSNIKSRDNTHELGNQFDITNSNKLMIEEIDNIGESPDESLDFNNKKEQEASVNNNEELATNFPAKTSSDVSGLQYVQGDMIELDKEKNKDVYFVNAQQDEFVEFIASEDIVVEACEDYPPECQYVIIVEDKGEM